MDNISVIEVMGLYDEMIKIQDEDIDFAKTKKSIPEFDNDLVLYYYICDSLLKDLTMLEEYRLCSKIKTLKEKIEYSLDED
jgi:hypothetical protein